MTKITKYCNTITQSSGTHDRDWKNIQNIKNNEDTYAETNTIMAKSKPLRNPATLTLSNFKANLPTGARIQQVIVTYRHSKYASDPKKVCNIGAPTISLMKSATNTVKYKNGKAVEKKGQAPTTTAKAEAVTFKGDWDWTTFNATDFGVRINYPSNTNEYEGTVRIWFIRVKIVYSVASYGIKIKKVSGGYNKKSYKVNVTLSNKHGTRYVPSVVITAPVGFSLLSWKGNGKLTKENTRTFIWTPKDIKKVKSVQLTLKFNTDVTYPTGSSSFSGDIEASFTVGSSNGGYAKHTAIITDQPKSSTETTTGETTYYEDTSEEPITDIISMVKDEPIDYVYTITEEDFNSHLHGIYNYGITQGWWSGTFDNTKSTILNNFGIRLGGTTYLSIGQNIYRKTSDDPETWSNTSITKTYQWLSENNYSIPLTLKKTTVGGVDVLPYYVVGTGTYSSFEINIGEYDKFFEARPVKSDLTDENLTCSILTLTQEELNRLGDGHVYTAQDFMKTKGPFYETEDHETSVITWHYFVPDWYKTYRVGVFNNAIKDNITIVESVDPETGETIETTIDSTDYNNLSTSDILKYAEYWSTPLNLSDTYQNLECDFVYNKNYPLYIIISGAYKEMYSKYEYGTTANCSVKFTEPCIIDKTDYDGYQVNGIYPTPIDNIVTTSDTTEITIPARATIPPVILYDLPLEEDYGTNDEIAIRGLEVSGNIEKADELILTAKLINGKNESRERSTILSEYDTNPDGDNSFTIGGKGDLWGFKTSDIVNLKDWEIELTTSNPHEQAGNLNINDLQLVIYVENIENNNVKCFIEDQDLSYYGVFLRDVKIPEGLKTNTKFITVDGTDTNYAYQQNIKEKTIEIEFDVGDCGLEESTNSLRELTRLLVNKRDEYNRPIPKTIMFEHYPDVYWEYILEDTIDSELDINTYVVKAKLTIPSGTAYSRKDVTSNTVGYVTGITAVRPTITLQPDSDTISITEQISGQTFTMGFTGDWNDKIVEIDCENRIVLLYDDDTDDEGDDITAYVDFNSDWFTLYEEYEFDSVNCTIYTVNYTPRW